jgi:proteic killer suppression protein
MAIQGFKCRDTQLLFETGESIPFQAFARVATRKLAMIHAAGQLDDLRSPPGNRLEALQGDRFGQHSIRINAQMRICFVWMESGPKDVEINKHYE